MSGCKILRCWVLGSPTVMIYAQLFTVGGSEVYTQIIGLDPRSPWSSLEGHVDESTAAEALLPILEEAAAQTPFRVVEIPIEDGRRRRAAASPHNYCAPYSAPPSSLASSGYRSGVGPKSMPLRWLGASRKS